MALATNISIVNGTLEDLARYAGEVESAVSNKNANPPTPSPNKNV